MNVHLTMVPFENATVAILFFVKVVAKMAMGAAVLYVEASTVWIVQMAQVSESCDNCVCSDCHFECEYSSDYFCEDCASECRNSGYVEMCEECHGEYCDECGIST